MTASKKPLLNWIAAAALALGAFGVQAQTPAPQPAPGKHQVDPAQRAAHHAQRTAEFKQKLNLTPNQQAAWEQYQAATKPMGRPDAHKGKGQRDERPQLSDAQKAEMKQRMAAQRQAHQQAKQAFYAQLTPAQQQVFDAETKRHHKRRGEHRGEGKHN